MPSPGQYFPKPKIGHDAPENKNEAELEMDIRLQELDQIGKKSKIFTVSGREGGDRRKGADFLKEISERTGKASRENVFMKNTKFVAPPLAYIDEQTGRSVIGITKVCGLDSVEFIKIDKETQEIVETKNIEFMKQLPQGYLDAIDWYFDQKSMSGEKGE